MSPIDSPIDDVYSLPASDRAGLLEVLTASRRVRADAIQRNFGTPDGQRMADLLIELEVDSSARAQVINTLREQRELTA